MLVMAFVLLVPAAAFAAEKKKGGEPEGENLNRVLFELEAGVYSKYVWRGIRFVDDWVLQTQFDVKWRGFTFTGWGNLDLTNENGDRGRFTEIDLSADYGVDVGPVDLNFGAIGYTFRSHGRNTLEIYASAGLNVLLKPTLTLYRDIDEAEGNYLAFSVKHVFERLFSPSDETGPSPELTASIAYAGVDYNAYYYRVRSAGFADLTAAFSVPWKLSKKFTVFASINYSVLIDSQIRDRAADKSSIWIGFGGSILF